MADIKEEERITRLEERVEFLAREVQEIKQDVKELKEELHRVEVSLREEIHKLRLLMVVVIFLIIFLNQNALEFILRILGILK